MQKSKTVIVLSIHSSLKSSILPIDEDSDMIIIANIDDAKLFHRRFRVVNRERDRKWTAWKPFPQTQNKQIRINQCPSVVLFFFLPLSET